MRTACFRLTFWLGAALCALAAVPPGPVTARGNFGPRPAVVRYLQAERGVYLALRQIVAASHALAQGNPQALTAGLLGARGQLRLALSLLGETAPGTVRDLLLAVDADLLPEELVADPALAEFLLDRAGADLTQALRALRTGDATLQAGSRITVQPTPLDFGRVCVGESRDLELTVTNKTAVAREVFLRSPAGDPYTQEPLLEVTLGAGETAAITVRFAPQKRDRFRRSIFLSAAAAGTRDAGIYVALDGYGELVGQSPDPLDFGEVTLGSSRTLPVTLTNCQDQPIEIHFRVNKRFSAQGPVNFAPHESKEIPVTFTPDAAGEIFFDVPIRADSGRGLRRIGEIRCRGVGKEPVKVGARLIDFGAVATNQFHTRTLPLENNTSEPQEVEIDASRFHTEFWTVQPRGKVVLAPHSVTPVSFRFGAVGRCKHQARLTIKHPSFRRGIATTLVKVRTR